MLNKRGEMSISIAEHIVSSENEKFFIQLTGGLLLNSRQQQ